MNRYYYWLDDERPNPDPNRYHSTMSAPDLIACLKKHGNDLSQVTVHLDHDLGICRKCSDAFIPFTGPLDCTHRGNGYDVLLWIEEQTVTNPEFIPPVMKVHSSNAGALPKMKAAIQSINNHYGRRNSK